MQLDGVLGYHGWQWLFIIEGLPAMLLPIAVWKYMPDGPHEASWLTADEKRWIQKEVESDREKVSVTKTESSVKGVFTNPMVWAFSFIYFVSTTTNYGLSMFMPQIIKQLGFSTMQTGFVMFVPYIIGCAGMLIIGYLSDRHKERKWHLIACCMMIAIGLGVAGWLGNTIGAIGAMCFAAIGIMGFKGPFWPLPSAYLSGAGAAAGIALINSVGNLGGFAGPYAVGLAKQMTGSFTNGLYALAAVALAGAFLTFFVIKVHKPQETEQTMSK
jgi:ACS family tartrate transporter-like MFS transporter